MNTRIALLLVFLTSVFAAGGVRAADYNSPDAPILATGNAFPRNFGLDHDICGWMWNCRVEPDPVYLTHYGPLYFVLNNSDFLGTEGPLAASLLKQENGLAVATRNRRALHFETDMPGAYVVHFVRRNDFRVEPLTAYVVAGKFVKAWHVAGSFAAGWGEGIGMCPKGQPVWWLEEPCSIAVMSTGGPLGTCRIVLDDPVAELGVRSAGKHDQIVLAQDVPYGWQKTVRYHLLSGERGSLDGRNSFVKEAQLSCGGG